MQRKIADLELALEEMKRVESPTAHAVVSKGVVAQIEQMREETDEYLGISWKELEEPQAITE
jgi:hypothetical protein